MGKIISITILALAITLLSACATRLEKDYGYSFRIAKEQQILQPEAGQNQKPMEGIDGEAAANSLEKFRGEFKKDSTNQKSVLKKGLK